jgi:ubiquinone/menaquinone biosynthesis C-methylase UbiE
VRTIVAALERTGVDLAAARVLEAGCGHGYTAAAIAAAGAGEVVGIDLDIEGVGLAEESEAVRTALAGDGRVRLETGDLRDLRHDDATFDAVVSIAVLEHVDDIPRALAELHRVTTKGGVGYHGIDLWFGTGGGHSLCTLDAPWGHVRLSELELERYLRELRPHEAADALDHYRSGFQRPRRTLSQMAASAREAGFDVLAASHTRLPLRDPHRTWLSAEVLRECRRAYPVLEPSDLLSVSATLILRRR